MGLAYNIQFSSEADADLRAIGGQTEAWLIGELYLLPQQPEDRYPKLAWDQAEPPRRRWDIGLYTAVFYVYLDLAGTGAAVIERLVERVELERYVAELLAAGGA